MQQKDVKISGQSQETLADPGNQMDINADAENQDGAQLSRSLDGVSEVERLQQEVGECKDKFIRLAAEFDNFKRRTAKERNELVQTAAKDVIVSLLDVLDDCDRAQKQMETSQDVTVIKDGVMLIFNKLRNILQSKGLKPMESIKKDFNPDLHEAITDVPAPSEKLIDKVLDEVQRGYYLNDKIIRFAKVIVGK